MARDEIIMSLYFSSVYSVDVFFSSSLLLHLFLSRITNHATKNHTSPPRRSAWWCSSCWRVENVRSQFVTRAVTLLLISSPSHTVVVRHTLTHSGRYTPYTVYSTYIYIYIYVYLWRKKRRLIVDGRRIVWTGLSTTTTSSDLFTVLIACAQGVNLWHFSQTTAGAADFFIFFFSFLFSPPFVTLTLARLVEKLGGG